MIRIELPELGEDQYIEIRNPKVITYDTALKMAEVGEGEDIASRMKQGKILAASLIVGGHVLDIDDNPVQFPLDEAVVGQLPAEAIAAVLNKYNEVKGAGNGPKS